MINMFGAGPPRCPRWRLWGKRFRFFRTDAAASWHSHRSADIPVRSSVRCAKRLRTGRDHRVVETCCGQECPRLCAKLLRVPKFQCTVHRCVGDRVEQSEILATIETPCRVSLLIPEKQNCQKVVVRNYEKSSPRLFPLHKMAACYQLDFRFSCVRRAAGMEGARHGQLSLL